MLTAADSADQLGAGARWSVMVVSLWVTATSFLFINGVAFLIPSLQERRGISLTEAALLSSMPSWGMVVTLVLWGWVLDRVGESLSDAGRTASARGCGRSAPSPAAPR